MFRGLLYVLSVNKSLAELGLDCRAIPKELRREAQKSGYHKGYSPQEIAASIVIFLGPQWQPPAFDFLVSGWVIEGKIRREILQSFHKAADIVSGKAERPNWLPI